MYTPGLVSYTPLVQTCSYCCETDLLQLQYWFWTVNISVSDLFVKRNCIIINKYFWLCKTFISQLFCVVIHIFRNRSASHKLAWLSHYDIIQIIIWNFACIPVGKYAHRTWISSNSLQVWSVGCCSHCTVRIIEVCQGSQKPHTLGRSRNCEKEISTKCSHNDKQGTDC